ncbi:sulfate transporter [Chlorella sorokiniana]|uniref:Sulfate transporter n=1 Tax=Chlorella sorokiniana TaxID=3076 RepID=A0A2P6TWH4_CHLSO|nr:sulfate transporter [Chlorella sorokiniana]|eukprot:PRW58410.1 sulfate transporter [Chlorella sorokiniana]
MPAGPDPTLEARPGADESGAGSADTARPVQRGLLSRLSGSFGAAASAAAAAAGAAAGQPGAQAERDLEQPLLPGSHEEEAQYVAHNMEHKRWPELRLSSISTRRLSPSMLSPTASIMLSFAAIIFRDPFFRPMLGSLVKLVFLSSALHQAAFAALSSMPFAVGQVQDVGLIFLSAMASAVVQQCGEAGWGEADTLATVLATLTLATAVVGVLIVGTGALRLAGLVQYVPLPVVGGYLCFVGYFCLAAGVSLATGLHVGDLSSWAQLASRDALIKLAPALGMVLLITAVLHRVRSPFALPALLLAAPAVFYGVLAACGWSLADARAAGWVSSPQEGDSAWRFWRAWSLYGLRDFPPSNILWAAMPGQLGKLLTLYFIVAFGSSMDIAAIQADTAQDLDYNSELVTVGLSNILTAACGVGYTGSYIFSQTLFSMRMGIDTPLMGAIIAVAEVAVFMLPFNPINYLPGFYFGGLTAWIGQDILKDWLFIAAKRVSAVEYCLLLATFGLVMAFGLEGGIAGGIVLAALHFAYSYSKVTMTAFTVVPSRSGAVRTFDQRTVLDMFSGRITAVSLSGYLFFGSSVNVVERVVQIANSTLDSQPHYEQGAGAAAAEAAVVAGAAAGAAGAAAGEQQQQRAARLVSMPSMATLCNTFDGVQQFVGKDAALDGAQVSKVAAALAESPRFLILDFRRVQGLDATAARSFVTLHNKLHRMGIQLIITHIPARRGNVRRLLAAQGLILRQPTAVTDLQDDSGPVCAWFPTMDAGCQHCEERFLAVAVAHGLCPPPAPAMTLAQVLHAHLELPRCILGEAAVDYQAAAGMLQRFAYKRDLRAGDVVFQLGAPADEMYIVERGQVVCRIDFNAASVHSRSQLPAVPADARPASTERVFKYGPGGLFGELDFFLQRPRSFTAVADRDSSAWCIDRRAFETMAKSDPSSLVLLETIVLRSTCLSAAHALEALERSSGAD